MATTTKEQANGENGLTAKDFKTDQDVRWCPGCGDYAILAQMQKVLPEIGIPKEDIVFVSGIGCAARFPYYMNTYGMHSIHGRAPSIATGLKTSRPELSVWIVTGDGDALSIGGNHLIHLLRRNLDVNLLLFNNEIYGLTKGQYSPTSEQAKVTKSTPHGSVDNPFNPGAVALGADATFVARTMDRDPKHLRSILSRSYQHTGSSFVEIYQNCNIFNDGAFFPFTEKETKQEEGLYLEHGEPLLFGAEKDKGLKLDGFQPIVIDLNDGYTADECWVHDETDIYKAQILSRIFENPHQDHELPRPFGVLYATERPTYETVLNNQLNQAIQQYGDGDLDELLAGPETWEIL